MSLGNHSLVISLETASPRSWAMVSQRARMAAARRCLVSSSGCRKSMEKLTSSGMTFTAPGLTSHFPSVTTAGRPSRSTSRVINERISHINLSHRPTMTFTGRHGVECRGETSADGPCVPLLQAKPTSQRLPRSLDRHRGVKHRGQSQAVLQPVTGQDADDASPVRLIWIEKS